MVVLTTYPLSFLLPSQQRPLGLPLQLFVPQTRLPLQSLSSVHPPSPSMQRLKSLYEQQPSSPAPVQTGRKNYCLTTQLIRLPLCTFRRACLSSSSAPPVIMPSSRVSSLLVLQQTLLPISVKCPELAVGVLLTLCLAILGLVDVGYTSYVMSVDGFLLYVAVCKEYQE